MLQACAAEAEACGCRGCSGAFHCPRCRALPRVRDRCTAEEERRVVEEERRVRREREEKLREEQRVADELWGGLAEAVNDFYGGLGADWEE